MIRKIVFRSPCTVSGENLGSSCLAAEPVVDQLIITPDVAVLRGEMILDQHGYRWVALTVSGAGEGNYLPGKIALVVGTAFGDLLCKITGVQYDDNFQTGSSTMQIALKVIKQ